MRTYLRETRHAAEGLITLFTHDLREHSAAKRQCAESMCEVTAWMAEMQAKDLTQEIKKEEFWDHFVNHVRVHTRQARVSNERAADIGQVIEAKMNSLSALCGALLQIAKQGISTVYGAGWQTDCPLGRPVGGESLRTVIWEGRNHSMHYEDAPPRPGVTQCFKGLEASFGSRFSLVGNPKTNLSLEVVGVLGWFTYDAYERDMLSLARPGT